MIANEQMIENPLRKPPSEKLAKEIEMRSNPMLTKKVKEDEENTQVTVDSTRVAIDTENIEAVEDEERPHEIHAIVKKAEHEQLNGLIYI